MAEEFNFVDFFFQGNENRERNIFRRNRQSFPS